MKMHFTMIVSGGDSLETKFQAALKENPALHMELIKGFAQILMLGLRLNESDNISIESFRAGKIQETPPASDPQSETTKSCEQKNGCEQAAK